MQRNLFCKIMAGLFLLSALFALELRAAMTGPYDMEGAAVFIVHDGGPLQIRTKLLPKDKKEGAVVLRIQDAEENEVFWDYTKFSEEKTLGYDFGKNAPKGIYQIRLSGLNYRFDPVTIPEKKYGVMASTCCIYFGKNNQFDGSFFLIPEGSKSLFWNAYGLRMAITQADGTQIDCSKEKKADLTGKAGQIWRLSLKGAHPSRFCNIGFGGMSTILCPDAETAKAINGSIEKAPDGTIYAHKFQVKMHEWLKSLTPEDLKVDVVDLRTRENEFRAEPGVAGLIGPWGVFTYINYQIKAQNLDPKSPKFGYAPGGGAGLAIANSLNKPFNPYAGKLEKRLLLEEFPKFLKMYENDTWENGWSNYPGEDALDFSGKGFPFYYGINSIQDKTLRDLWIGAVRRFCDRFSMFRASCENQSSHYLFYYQAVYDTLKLDGYKRLAEDFVAHLNNPEENRFYKTGYHQEAYGPDITYSGLAQSFQALYYRMSGNKKALEGCRTVHRFFAHSAVREPDGKIVCSSNFAHRTEGGWDNAQYGAGRNYLQAEVEEAAAFTQPPPEKPEPIDYRKYLDPNITGQSAIGYAASSFGPYLNAYVFPTKRMENPRLPFEQKEEFTTNFNNEFLAVRKPGYYAFTYLNGTADSWIKNRRYKTAENPSTYKWASLQGLCITWFKDYGAFIVGRNFNGNVHQILRGDLPDGRMAYPDYWAHKAVVDGDAVKATGILFQAEDVAYVRNTEFLDDGIRQTLEVKFAKDVTFKSLSEQIPFYEAKPDFKLEYRIDGKWGTEPGMADALRFGDKIVVRFDKAYLCERGPSKKPIGSLKIHLGKEFKAGSSVKMSYTIRPESAFCCWFRDLLNLH